MEELNIIFLRNQRNELLKASDKYLISDYPISNADLEAVKQWRQELRDFSNNDFIMPDPPNFIISWG